MKRTFATRSDGPGEIVRRTIHPEVKVIDAAKGLVDYVASDETVDHYQDLILAKGWRFTHFKKNAPFLDSHMSWSIGDCLGKVVDAKVENNQLIERAQWAIDVEGNDLARIGFDMTAKGYLKAVSVGFYPTKLVSRWDEDFAEVVVELGLDAETAATVRRIYLEQEQMELSACVIGANPNALAKAYEDGAIAEEQLHSIGFGGDDEFDFLQKAAAACEIKECGVAFKAMMALEMQRIYSERKTFQNKRSVTTPGPSSSTRDAEEKAQRRAMEKRQAFLDELDALTK